MGNCASPQRLELNEATYVFKVSNANCYSERGKLTVKVSEMQYVSSSGTHVVVWAWQHIREVACDGIIFTFKVGQTHREGEGSHAFSCSNVCDLFLRVSNYHGRSQRSDIRQSSYYNLSNHNSRNNNYPQQSGVNIQFYSPPVKGPLLQSKTGTSVGSEDYDTTATSTALSKTYTGTSAHSGTKTSSGTPQSGTSSGTSPQSGTNSGTSPQSGTKTSSGTPPQSGTKTAISTSSQSETKARTCISTQSGSKTSTDTLSSKEGKTRKKKSHSYSASRHTRHTSLPRKSHLLVSTGMCDSSPPTFPPKRLKPSKSVGCLLNTDGDFQMTFTRSVDESLEGIRANAEGEKLARYDMFKAKHSHMDFEITKGLQELRFKRKQEVQGRDLVEENSLPPS